MIVSGRERALDLFNVMLRRELGKATLACLV
jgi:hypothetical protein